MSNIDLVVENFSEEEQKQFPHLYTYGIAETQGNPENPFTYDYLLPGTRTQMESVAKRTELVDTVIESAETPREMLTNYLNYFKLIKSIPDCDYLRPRRYNRHQERIKIECKGTFTTKANNLLELTGDIIAYCKSKDPTLFTNSETMMLLNEILYTIVTLVGVHSLASPEPHIKPLINKINSALGEERIKFTCGDNFANGYTCARAVGYIPCERDTNSPGYILVFDTVSTADSSQNMDTFFKYWRDINENLCEKKPENKNTNKSTNASGAGAGSASSGGKRKVKKTRRIPKKQKRKSRKY